MLYLWTNTCMVLTLGLLALSLGVWKRFSYKFTLKCFSTALTYSIKILDVYLSHFFQYRFHLRLSSLKCKLSFLGGTNCACLTLGFGFNIKFSNEKSVSIQTLKFKLYFTTFTKQVHITYINHVCWRWLLRSCVKNPESQ